MYNPANAATIICIMIPKTSVSFMLGARWTYQAYINVHMIAFCALAAVTMLLAVLLTTVIALVPPICGLVAVVDSPWLTHHFGHCPFRQWLSMIGSLLAVVLVLPIVLLFSDYWARTVRADKIPAILATLLAIATGLAWQIHIVYDTPHPAKVQVAKVLIYSAYLMLMLLFSLLHLICASASRFNERFRLSARAAQADVRSIRLRYQIGASRIQKLVPAFWRFAGLQTMRNLAVILPMALGMIAWDASESWRARWPKELADFDFGPTLVICGVACAHTLIKLFTEKGRRVLNLALLYFLADMAFKVALQYKLNVVITSNALAISLVVLLRTWLLAPLRNFIAQARLVLISSAARAARLSRRPLVLLLRSFADERLSVTRTSGAFLFMMGEPTHPKFLEEIVSETLSGRGPVIALSDPSARMPPLLGALRDVVPDDTWRDRVLELIKSAQVIVCILGRTSSFQWELEQIVALGALSKTILVLGPGYPGTGTISEYNPVVARHLGLETAQWEKDNGEGIRCVVFDPKRSAWRAITSRKPTERAYIECLRISSEIIVPS